MSLQECAEIFGAGCPREVRVGLRVVQVARQDPRRPQQPAVLQVPDQRQVAQGELPQPQLVQRAAGAEVVDEKVVVDGGIITSRNPDDLDAFVGAIEEALG